MLELNSFVFTHVQVRSISALPPRRWNVREVVKKDGSRRDLVVLRWIEFFVYLNFQPRVISCPPSCLYLVNISQFLPYLPVYRYLSGIYRSFCLHAPKWFFFFPPEFAFISHLLSAGRCSLTLWVRPSSKRGPARSLIYPLAQSCSVQYVA